MLSDETIDDQIFRLRATFGGRWPDERIVEWRRALRGLTELELAEAVTSWIRDKAEQPRGPGAIRALALSMREQPSTDAVRGPTGEATYRCYLCRDTGGVDAIFERDGTRQVCLVPCRASNCSAGARTKNSGIAIPADVSTVKIYDRLGGVFDDPS